MNWILIFLLSLFGVAIGIAELYGLATSISILIWIVIFFFYAFMIVKYTRKKYFLHGFLVSLINGFWIAAIHVIFFNIYMKYNPELAVNYQNMPHITTHQNMILIMGPVIGAVLGLISGSFSLVTGKLWRFDDYYENKS